MATASSSPTPPPPPSCWREDRITISVPESNDDDDNNDIYVRLDSVTTAGHPKHPLLFDRQPLSVAAATTRRIFSSSSSAHHHENNNGFSGVVVQSISIYMASESSKVMPRLRFFEEPDERFVVKTGPSGIMVQVQFDQRWPPSSAATAAARTKSGATTNSPTLVLDLFYDLLIDLVDDQVLPGPFGLSLRRHRLHRHVQCTSGGGAASTRTGSTTTTTGIGRQHLCMAHIPLEGAHSAASAESFRQFLHGGTRAQSITTGVFSMASPYEWSSWWMGKTSQSLDDARNVMAGTGFDHHRDDTIPTRTARWMEWSRDCTTGSDATNSSCQWRVAQGIHYNVMVRNLAQKLAAASLPLSSLLPTAESSILTIDPLADHTFVDVVQTGRKKRKRITLAETEQLRHLEEHATSARLRYSPITSKLDLRRVFLRNDGDAAADSVTTTTTMATPPMDDSGRCSAHSRLLRDRGQSNTGTLELYAENACGGGIEEESLCHFTIVQPLPAFFAPIWRSLQILVDDQSIPFRNLLQNSHIDFNDDGSSLITMHSNATKSLRLLLDYDPVFLSIDSFPGDANRGFEIPPAVASFQCGTAARATTTTTVHLYTDTQLVLSPLPDMSMPFNVVSLTCTFYAFVVGSILNLAIKKASKHVKDQLDADQAEPSSLAGKIKAKLSSLFLGVYQKLQRIMTRKTPLEESGNQSVAPFQESVAVRDEKEE